MACGRPTFKLCFSCILVHSRQQQRGTRDTTMWANVAESITLELAGEVVIVFCMYFVLACSVISLASLASAEWEGHEDEREPRTAGAQCRGPQKHLAAASCGERVSVVEVMSAPKQERIARTETAVVKMEKLPKREGGRLRGSDEPTPSRTLSNGMRRSSSHGSLTSAPFESVRRRAAHESLQPLSQSSTRPKGMRHSSSRDSLEVLSYLSQSSTPSMRRSSSQESLQPLSQSLKVTRPKGMRHSSSHESLASTRPDHFQRHRSSSWAHMRRSSSHESLELLFEELLSQSPTSKRPEGMRHSSSHESSTSLQGDHFRRRHTSSQERLASACAEGLSRTSSCTSRASSCTSDESLTSSLGSLGSFMRRNNWSSTSLHSIEEDSALHVMG